MLNAKYLYVPGDSASALITSGNVTGVESNSSNTPEQYYLGNNYPNPFNPSTTIEFGLPEQSQVTLSVFNILGQKVLEMRDRSLAAGVHSTTFNASQLGSGVYFYSIHATGNSGRTFVEFKKMTLLR
jgi:hypothetical protein